MDHDPVTVVVKGLLETHGMSGRELARRSGIATGTLNRRLNNVAPWRVAELDRVARVFGIRASDLKALAEDVAA